MERKGSEDLPLLFDGLDELLALDDDALDIVDSSHIPLYNLVNTAVGASSISVSTSSTSGSISSNTGGGGREKKRKIDDTNSPTLLTQLSPTNEIWEQYTIPNVKYGTIR